MKVQLPTIGQTFPSLHRSGALPADHLNSNFSIVTARSVDLVLAGATNYQKALAETTTTGMSTWTKAFFEDLTTLKRQQLSPIRKSVVDYMRFHLATGALSHCVGTGQMSRAYEWLALCLNDDLAVSELRLGFHAEFTRLEAFLAAAHRSLQTNAPRTICVWTFFTYTYSSSMNSLYELVTGAFEHCRAAAQRAYPSDEAVTALLTMAYWSIDLAPQAGPYVAAELEALYGTGDGPAAGSLAVALASPLGDYTERGRTEWLAICDRLWDTLKPEEQLRVLLRRMRDLAAFDRERERLFALFEAFRPPANAPIAAVEQFHERNASQLGPLLMDLVRAGRSEDASEILVHFYNVDPNGSLEGALFCSPFNTRGALWAGQDLVREMTEPEIDSSTAISTLKDALGISIQPDADGRLVSRYGSPDEALGMDLAATTSSVLGLDTLDIEPFAASAPCLVFSTSPFPYQATMLPRLEDLATRHFITEAAPRPSHPARGNLATRRLGVS